MSAVWNVVFWALKTEFDARVTIAVAAIATSKNDIRALRIIAVCSLVKLGMKLAEEVRTIAEYPVHLLFI